MYSSKIKEALMMFCMALLLLRDKYSALSSGDNKANVWAAISKDLALISWSVMGNTLLCLDYRRGVAEALLRLGVLYPQIRQRGGGMSYLSDLVLVSRGYCFLLVKMDASPVMAIMAGAIEATGWEK
jgi:hypothetical protein